MVKNIIFDIGNVLVAFDYKGFFRSFGYDEGIVERLSKATAEHPIWKEIDRGVQTYEEIVEEFIKNDPEIEVTIRKTFINLKGLLGRYDYAIPWIKALKEKGYHVYYLSNFSEKAGEDCAETLDFLPYMDGGVFSCEEKIIKPDPAIYQLLLTRYDLKAEECVFLDDTEKNIIAAKKEGIHGIVFHNKEQAAEELKLLGVDA